MNLFNRVVTILLFAALMIAIPVVLVFPDPVLACLQPVIGSVSGGLSIFHRVVLVLVGIICFIICGLVLYLEFRRPRRRTVRLAKAAGGEVELAIESIAQRLEYRVDQLTDVVKVKPKIKPRRKDIDVELNLETTPDIDVPTKTEEVCQVVREVVEERMGLKLRNIKVNIRHAPHVNGPLAS
jgi:uncharacterized alkaline shock family protein YloU